ncbi:hamartin-like isoform X2 [Conger conger]|uniref:hamartin-like isoform X2 n=1 Tax=Conger conger TaxID=82655 RepID=UPI002A59B06C|nr:hamartin-like isoform X2 [Conger conger]
MARDQSNVSDLLPLLECSDLRQLDQVKALINEQLSTERGSVLLNGLVDYYLESGSAQALQILTSVREPHDKHLLDKLNESLSKPTCRLSTLSLLGHVVRKQPSWIHKITRFPLLASLLKCLKTDSDVVVLITGVLVLITLLPMIPQAGRQHLYDFFDIFGRLAAWNLRNPGHVTEVFLIHLHASVYSLFHRLYGMYPCNFISYLRSHYSMKENMDTFQEVVKPMLEHVRIHPELVTGTKDHELDPTRWKKFEIHDIVIECAKVSLDPKEASCEEGYSTQPDHFSGSALSQPRPPDSSASPYTDLHSSYGSSSSTQFSTPRQTQPPQDCPHTTLRQILSYDVTSSCVDPIWSPSSICGMATPPSSRGISPTNVLELSQSASHLPGRTHAMAAGGKGPPSAPAALSPHPPLTEELLHSVPPNTADQARKDGGPAESGKPCLVRQEPIRELERDSSAESDSRGDVCESVSMTLTELSAFVKEQEQDQQTEREEAIAEELLKITQDRRDVPALRGFDSPFFRTTETLTGAQEQPPSAPPAPDPPAPDPPSTPDRTEGAPATDFTPIDHPTTEEEGSAPPKYNPFSPGPCKTPPVPYKDLFDMALPKAASLFVGRRTAAAGWRSGEEPSLEEGDGFGEGEPSMSPLEVLDRLIQQGSNVHEKVLKRLPLPSKSADWTHFGGPGPLDELQTLRSQLLLLHSQLLFERYKREQHALRNRRLLRRIINTTALQEHNSAMKDRLSLQKVDLLALRDSLQVEQQRYKQLWADRETVVTCLHNQIRQLQQGRDEYYSKNQELQSKLQESQKRIGELEAELQRANYEVCNTTHQLNQLSVKLSSSESAQQQKAFLNKQLLLLGEVNRLCVEELQHCGHGGKKEVRMLQASSRQEQEQLRRALLQCTQSLEVAQQRGGALEAQLAQKEHLIAEHKRFLEDVKGQAKAELQASESRVQAQRKVTQALQTELLQLYSRLDSPPGGASEPCGPHNTRPAGGSSSVLDGQVKAGVQDCVDGDLSDSHRSSSSTLSPGQPQASPMANSINGSRDPPALLPAPPPSRPPSTPPSRLADAPLAVGSSPSAKSFLGIQARELFRNKSGEGEEPVATPRLAGLSQGLKTELCPAPRAKSPAYRAKSPAYRARSPASPSKGPAQADTQQRARNRSGGGARGRGGAVGGAGHTQQRQLRIMDYNETHHHDLKSRVRGRDGERP